MGKQGRPTKYKEEYAEQARKLCLLGFINEQLAEFFGVGTTTIDRWISDIDSFRGAIKEGRAVADAKVAQSLYKRACGYTTEEVTKGGGGNDEDGENKGFSRITKKEVPPDTAAAFIWLKNRQPKLWRDKREIQAEVTTTDLTLDLGELE